MEKKKLKDTWPTKAEDHYVVVLGASPKKSRYSNQAIQKLLHNDYKVIPVHPKISVIESLPVIANLALIKQPVHTLTLYVGPERSAALIEKIVKLNPHRVILNPGTESELLEEALKKQHIHYFHACTLVMLSTDQFLNWS